MSERQNEAFVYSRRHEERLYRVFLGSLALIIAVSLAGVFLGMALRNATLIRESVLARGRSLFQELVLARRWAAAYGGVYVLKREGVESNPWLEHPDLQAADGRMLTLRNPALMTREISEIALREADFHFKITSLKPLNPGNAPDAFEREALELFESGITETWADVDDEAGREFRYMGALATEASCLACHAKQGYSVGDVRGGISVSFSIEAIRRELRFNAVVIVIAGLVLSAAVLALVYALVSKLRRQLVSAREELERIAITDSLTGLYNRRYATERLLQELDKSLRTKSPLCCAMFDADDFKRLNDEEGHARGDIALKAIAAALESGSRPYDVVARYGGEEFLVVFPGANRDDGLLAFDRMRISVAESTALALGNGRCIQVSIGIACVETGEMEAYRLAVENDGGGAETVRITMDALLARADRALYRAKAAGKNRCELA